MKLFMNELKKSVPSKKFCGTLAINTSDELVLLLLAIASYFSNNHIVNLKHLLKNHRLFILLNDGLGL